MSTQTLFEALQAIPDHRTRKGRRFSLATILTISLAAMLSGADDLMAIYRWGRRLSPAALQALGADKKRRRAPCHATCHYVFQALSAKDLQAALGVLVRAEGGLGHVAIKPAPAKPARRREPGANACAAASMRAAPTLAEQRGVHMLHAFSTKLQAAAGSLEVPPDSGECIEAVELLKSLPLEGAVVTGDAAFTMKPIVEAIRERGGDYFLFVVTPGACFQHDGNQPELKAELERAFGDLSP